MSVFFIKEAKKMSGRRKKRIKIEPDT